MFCTSCGKPLPGQGRLCVHCGVPAAVTQSAGLPVAVVAAPASSATPDQIRAELRRYDTLTTMKYLECGYSGTIGVVGVIPGRVPWSCSWWFLVPVLLTGIGLIPALIILIGRDLTVTSTERTKAVCPVCKKTLIERLCI